MTESSGRDGNGGVVVESSSEHADRDLDIRLMVLRLTPLGSPALADRENALREAMCRSPALDIRRVSGQQHAQAADVEDAVQDFLMLAPRLVSTGVVYEIGSPLVHMGVRNQLRRPWKKRAKERPLCATSVGAARNEAAADLLHDSELAEELERWILDAELTDDETLVIDRIRNGMKQLEIARLLDVSDATITQLKKAAVAKIERARRRAGG